MSGANVEVGLVAFTEDGASYDVPIGERVDVGRRATIPFGVDDGLMHELAFHLESLPTEWGVIVPPGERLEVSASSGGVELWSLQAGGHRGTGVPEAEILVRTTLREHRLRVVYRSGVDQELPHGTTQWPDEVLNLQNRNHRALIVACLDRLERPDAPPLVPERIAEVLHITPAAAKQQLRRGCIDVVVWIDPDADFEAQPRIDDALRARAVDWLVGTRAVTKRTVQSVLAEVRGPEER